MKSPLGSLRRPRNAGKPPIPLDNGYARRTGLAFNLGNGRQDGETFMRQYGMSGTLFGIVSLLAESSATPAWKLYKKPPQDGRVRYTTGDHGSDQRIQVVQHAAIQLWNNPNDHMSGFEFRESCQQHQELTGETIWVLDLDAGFPTSIWPVRPDRMEPVPDPENFLVGWIYTSPTGDQVPLRADEVIIEKRPNPLDPYRGAGPVASILPNIQQQRYATEYQRNLFLNGADPGGVITVPNKMSDRDFDELVDRWRESHRGVARAGQVGVLENGAVWTPGAHTNKDLEYGALRLANRDELREAWRIHKTMMGTADDVNRANAETAEEVFVSWQVIPRLNRRRDTLNSKLLPLFNRADKIYEFDYDDPSPTNAEAAANELYQKAQAAALLIGTNRFDPHDVLETVGLPDMSVVEVQQAATTPPAANPAGFETAVDGAEQNRSRERIVMTRPAAAAAPTAPPHDLSKLDAAWKKAVAAAVAAYIAQVLPKQRRQLAEQIADIIDSGDFIDLANLHVDHADGAKLLLAAMVAYAAASARHASAEAKAQGATVPPKTPDETDLDDVAVAVAVLAAARLAMSAATEAMRRTLADPDADGADIADSVEEYLADLSDADLVFRVSGAMSAAQNGARIATFLGGPTADLFASEVLDKSTCLMPWTRVTTRRGQIPASQVRLEDKVLTHLGRWVSPSRIPVSRVDEDVIVLTLADGRELSTTHDHHVLVLEDNTLVWREASQLAAGDLLIGESTLEEDGELRVPNLVLRQAPHNVAATGQVSSFTPVNVRAQRVPVASISLDGNAFANEEVHGPRSHRGLCTEVEAPFLEQLPHDAFDAGLETAGHVAVSRAVAPRGGFVREDSIRNAAQFAVLHDGRPSAGFAAVASVLSLAVPKGSTAALADTGTPTRVGRASCGAVVVAVGHGDGYGEDGAAVRARLADAVELRSDLGSHLGVGELAGNGTVDRSSLAATGDFPLADLAVARRVLAAPAFDGGVLLAAEPSSDLGAAIHTRLVHNVSVVEVRREAYSGLVYDFTIPGDETFWAEGVLVHNCSPCKAIDGTYIGNTADDNILDAVEALYPNGGYIDCAGADRCRGTIIAAYTTDDGISGRARTISNKEAAAKVFSQVAEDFPPAASAWMHHASWSGPAAVPVAHIDWTPGEMEDPDPERVQRFVAKLRAGKKLKPVIVVKTPGSDTLQLVDGHHRYLAYAELRKPVRAFIGVVDADHGPWEQMHSRQCKTTRAGPANRMPQTDLVGLARRVMADGWVPIETGGCTR